MLRSPSGAGVAELADAGDLKSPARKGVRVRSPPSAPITLVCEAGLRRIEICRARRDQVNLKRREIHIPADSSTNAFPRTVPLTRRVLAAIADAPVRLDGRLTVEFRCNRSPTFGSARRHASDLLHPEVER